jgi:uncharacterized membrane protein
MREDEIGQSRRLRWAGLCLGFALGGFFDGILLHQVLQWHHLLSGVEQARQDIKVLILADGLFHLFMYVIAGCGLWLLWRSRKHFALAGNDRALFADVLLGFGTWHVVDAILSHWVLGIHRIRMDVDNPLLWDLLWLALFGIVPIMLGWLFKRAQGHKAHAAMSSPLALALAVLVSGAIAAAPPPSGGPVMVLFAPGTTPQQAMAASQALEGRLIWIDPSQQLWAIDLPQGSNAAAFYNYGALLVSNSILPAGCLDWIKV